MAAGHLREKRGYFHIVLSYTDENGKRQTPSKTTGLPVKGNKKRAEAMLKCGYPMAVLNRKNAVGEDRLFFVCRTY